MPATRPHTTGVGLGEEGGGMETLFDKLGATHRLPGLAAAVQQLAENEATERGAIYTRSEVVAAILDLVEYVPTRPLHRLRLLEPSFGGGDFLLAALDRLLLAYQAHGGTPARACADLEPALRAVELHRQSFQQTALRLQERLVLWGMSATEAAALVASWLICDDFLLSWLDSGFDVVVGNPPYVRQERIPEALLVEYRRRYRTIYDRADLYVPFYERCLDLLGPSGVLGFICSNRWLKNKYGGPLREKISTSYHLAFFIDMEGSSAFRSEVTAYPAITVIRRQAGRGDPGTRTTRVVVQPDISPLSLARLTQAMRGSGPSSDSRITEVARVGAGSDPWLLDSPAQLRLLRRLEASLPDLETTGCKVGIGVATGADHVFIGPYRDLPVEDACKLPLVMAPDLQGGVIRWRGHGVVNPFQADGDLVSLEAFPRLQAHLKANREVIANRYVAKKNPSGWYRTIDRITPELTRTPKLLIPDIKGSATVVLDQGSFYPHHNLYFVTSSSWDLRALQAVLRSSVAMMFVATYCVKMAGGFLRFQAQYLRRIRVPRWEDVPPALRVALAEVAEEKEQAKLDAPVFQLYELSSAEATMVTEIAAAAQVRPQRRG